MQQGKAANFAAGYANICHLEGHAQYKAEISKIQKIGVFRTGEIKAAMRLLMRLQVLPRRVSIIQVCIP